jgi:hypothetical protein
MSVPQKRNANFSTSAAERTQSARIPEHEAEHDSGARADGSMDSTSERRTKPVKELNWIWMPVVRLACFKMAAYCCTRLRWPWYEIVHDEIDSLQALEADAVADDPSPWSIIKI